MKKYTGLLLLALSLFYISCSPEAPEVVDVSEVDASEIILNHENRRFEFNLDTLKFVNTKDSKFFFGKSGVVESFSFDSDAKKR